jgi:hypothetical protein
MEEQSRHIAAVEAIEEDRDGKDKVDRLHTVAVFG